MTTATWRTMISDAGVIYEPLGPSDPGLIPVAAFRGPDFCRTVSGLLNDYAFTVDMDAAIALDMPSIRDQVIRAGALSGLPSLAGPLLNAAKEYDAAAQAARRMAQVVERAKLAPTYAEDFPNRQARRRARHRR
jgi:hypothetical protein